MTCSEQSERNSDCYTSCQSRLRRQSHAMRVAVQLRLQRGLLVYVRFTQRVQMLRACPRLLLAVSCRMQVANIVCRRWKHRRKLFGIYKQIILRHNITLFIHYTTNTIQNRGESLVYHQFRRNCISPTQSVVYHHCESDTTYG